MVDFGIFRRAEVVRQKLLSQLSKLRNCPVFAQAGDIDLGKQIRLM